MASRKCLFAIALMLTSSGLALGAKDAAREGSMIKRVFAYDRDLGQADKVVVLVVSSDRDAAGLAETLDVFRANGLYPAVVAPGDLASEDLTATLTPQSAVIYVVDDANVGAVKAFAASKGFLTVSALPSLAEAGDVSVSVTMEGDRPQIIVNLPRLRAEGHELSSELLNLARVIR